MLRFSNLTLNPTMLELGEISKISSNGILDFSWFLPVPNGFVELQPKAWLGGHPLIVGRLWITITNDFISCIFWFMTIFDGTTNNSILYPLAKPIIECENPLRSKFELYEDDTYPLLTITKALLYKNESDDVILGFINDPSIVTEPLYRLGSFIMGNWVRKKLFMILLWIKYLLLIVLIVFQ